MSTAGNIKYDADGKVFYTNGSGGTLPLRSIVVVGGRIGILSQELADGDTGVADVTGIWPLPVLSTLTPAEGDVYGFDVADEELNEDLVNNTATAFVCVDSAGALCQITGYQWMLIG